MLTGNGEGGECLEWGFSRASEPVVVRQIWLLTRGAGNDSCRAAGATVLAQAADAVVSGHLLKVGAVDDPAILTGISLLRGEWEALRGGQIAMVEDPCRPEGASRLPTS